MNGNISTTEAKKDFLTTESLSNKVTSDNFTHYTESSEGLLENNFQIPDDSFERYYQIAEEISDISVKTASGILDGDISENIKELKNLLGQIKNIMDDTGENFGEGQKELVKVNKTLSDIVDNLAGFKSLVKHLRMLGISTKIESVRLGLEDRGFYTLAEDVEQLSTMITKKSLNIREKLTFLLNLVNNGKAIIADLSKTQSEYTAKNIDEARRSLETLNDKYKHTSLTAEAITGIAKNILESTSWTQKFNNTNDYSHGKLKQSYKTSEAKSNDPGEVYGKNQGADIVKKKNIGKQVTKLPHGGYSENDGIDSYNEAHSVTRKLNDYERAAGNIYSEILQLKGREGIVQKSLVEEISEKLMTVTNALEKDSKVADEMVASLSSVADTIADLSGFVDEIDEIGTEVELIALNASVKAAHTGEEGAALGVLAESIQKLSIDAKKQTAQLLEVLNSVMETAEKLRNNFNTKSGSGNTGNIASLTLKINNSLDYLIQKDAVIFSKMEELGNKALVLRDDIKKSIKKTDLHIKTKK